MKLWNSEKRCRGFMWLLLVFAIVSVAGQNKPHESGDDGEAPKKVEVKGGRTAVPMALFVKKPVVDVMINGKGPFKFFLDTGAGGTVLNQDLADELKLPANGTVKIGDPANPQAIEAKRNHIDRLEIGGATFSDLIAVSFDRSTLYQAGAPRGVLGMPLFQKLILTIDYPRNEIVIARGGLPISNGKDIIDYKPSEGGIFAVPLRVGDKNVMATIDTGSQSRLSFPPAFMDTLTLEGKPIEIGKGRTVAGESIIYGARLKDIVGLGGYSFDGLDVTFFARLMHPNLGYGFLNQFAVTIDQQNRRMKFEKRETVAAAGAVAVGKPGAVAAADAGKNNLPDVYAGLFGERRVSVENGELYLQRISGPMGEGPRLKLIEVSKDAYAISGMKNDVRVKFIRNAAGEITELQIMTPSGDWETGKKVKSEK